MNIRGGLLAYMFGLTVVLLSLKFLDVINVSYVWATIPLWGPVVVIILAGALGLLALGAKL